MGREVGGVQDGGTHVHPWLIHVNVWQKLPHYCKVISLQFKKKIYIYPLLDFSTCGMEFGNFYFEYSFDKLPHTHLHLILRTIEKRHQDD